MAGINTSAKVLIVDDTADGGTFWSEVREQSDRFASLARQNRDIANLMYTSGTTSTPKAAIHTHGMRNAVAGAMADCFKLSSRDVGLAISPIYHTSGLSVLCNCLFAGCPAVLLERWDLQEFLEAIRREKVTFMHLIGTIVVDIVTAPEEAFADSPRSLRFTWGGGHSIDAKSFETYERRLGGVFLQGYSRTEGGLTYNVLGPERRFDAHGTSNRNSSEVAIFDPVGEVPCPQGTTGEIVVRGDGVSPGYWDGDMIRSRVLYDGGWQPTGDLGFFDETGSLHFLGRDDHMIKTGGENVYPAEVERVLMALPDVSDAVVIGLPDARLGHRVSALVVPANAKVSKSDIETGCRRALAGFKIPRTIGFVSELPRLGNEKVDLAACRRILLQDEHATMGRRDNSSGAQ
jgi:acyl-CoA synthetase (AMP-forming)/AMP-acid ligase II